MIDEALLERLHGGPFIAYMWLVDRCVHCRDCRLIQLPKH